MVVGATVPIEPGTRIRVRHDNGVATITGGSGKTLDAGNLQVRRIDARTLEVITHGPATIILPRQTDLEVISAARTRGVNFRIDGVEGNVEATLGSANLTLKNIGGNVVATSANGNITADGVRGLVDVTTGNGNIILANVRSGVHIVSINGKTEISCASGAIDVKDTSGRVTVRNAAADVEIFTALGQAFYEGALRPGRSYRLRTLDGAVSLTYAANGAGFTARVDVKGKRQDIRAGDERARVVLDAVGGRVAVQKGSVMSGACAAVPVPR
jgi:hypothetical protein